MSENISDELGQILEVFEQWGDGVATVELIPSGEKKHYYFKDTKKEANAASFSIIDDECLKHD